MNIGLFTDTYVPQINGVATSTLLLSNELTKLGHNVYIFTTSDPQARIPQARVFRLPSMPVIFLKTHRLALLYPPKLLLKMKSMKLDLIHTQSEFPLGIFGKIVADFYKLPHVHTYHTMYEDYVHYIAKGYLITPKMAQGYSRIYCNGADAVIAPAQKTIDSLIDYGVTKPLHLIPTGINFAPFERGRFSDEELRAAKAEIGVNENDPIVITIARVAKEKSIDVVIAAMPKLLERIPNAKFVIVGPGPYREELESQARKLQVSDSVIFTGPRPWEIIGKYYQLGDVFVTASTSETQGLTYSESIAAGVPVVVKKDRSHEGIIIDGESGYIFEKDEDCADKLYEALTNKADHKRINENAMAQIAHLSSAAFGRKVSDLYEQVSAANREKKSAKHKFNNRKN